MACVYLTDPMNVPDTFVSGLGEVEDLGECFRFTYYTRHQVGGAEELTVVAKLIAPKSAILPALLMAAQAAGVPMRIANAAFAPGKGLN